MVKHRYKTNPTFGIVVNISEAPIWHVAETLYHVDWISSVAKPTSLNGYTLEHLEKVS